MYKLIITSLLFYCCFIISCNCREDSDIFHKCGDNLNCLEKELTNFVDHIQRNDVPIFGNYVILKHINNKLDMSRKNGDFIEKCIQFLENHELAIRIPKETSRSLLEEMRSSKIKKILLPILLLLKLKAAIVIPAILSAIALVAFKGLGASLIALAISGATGLKSLLEHHTSSKFTYEVVPQISSSHWSRTGLDPTNVAQHPAGLAPLASGYHTIP